MKEKKVWKKSALVVITVSCVAFTLDVPATMLPMIASPTVAMATENEPVIFPDENLEASVREVLGVGARPITQGMMKQLIGLRIIDGRGISSLEGLQYATNLRTLSAGGGTGSDIRDITPLANLTNLEFIYLTGNEHLSDISALSTLTGLKTLWADWCAIQQVPDLTALKKLEKLILHRNQIQNADFASTLSPSIKDLELSFNEISDASPLAGIHNAKIGLIVNHILDVSMLDWESNTIDSYGQTITLPVQKTGKSQLIVPNPVLSTQGDVLTPYSVNNNGMYQKESQQFIWPTLPTQPTGSVSFYYWEQDEKGEPYNSGLVTVPYEVVEASPVTARYVDTSGNKVAPDAILTGEYGTAYAAQTKNIPTYGLVGTPNNATGSYTDSAQTVTFVYDKSEAAPVTVRYESTAGKTIAPEETLTGKLEATYTAKEKDIPGYTLTKQPENTQGPFTDSAQTVRFVYEAMAGAPVKVQYVDEQGKALLPEKQLDGSFDDAYHAEAPTIAHYTLQDTPTNASGSFTLEPQTVTYRYAQTQGQTVTVSYTDSDGKTLSPDIQLTGAEGTSYQTAEKEIAGYHLLRVTGQETGTYSAEPQQVIYLYQADKEDETVVVPPANPNPVDEVVIPPTAPTVPKPGEATPTDVLPIRPGLPPTEEKPNPIITPSSVLTNTNPTNELVSGNRSYPTSEILPTTGDKATDWSVVLGGILLVYGVYYWRKGKH